MKNLVYPFYYVHSEFWIHMFKPQNNQISCLQKTGLNVDLEGYKEKTEILESAQENKFFLLWRLK